MKSSDVAVLLFAALLFAGCSGLILYELTFKEPRWWLVGINALAIALNVDTVRRRVRMILRKRERRAAGWLVD
jgi:hypothetical protein